MDIGDIRYLEAPAKVMKLSEAIRIGARMRPQGFADLFDMAGNSCALGAAYEGATGKTCSPHEYSKVIQEFPFLGCGATGRNLSDLAKTIYRMNDRQVKREQIADWLESEGY